MPLYDNDAPFTTEELSILANSVGASLGNTTDDAARLKGENLLAKVMTHYLRSKEEDAKRIAALGARAIKHYLDQSI